MQTANVGTFNGNRSACFGIPSAVTNTYGVNPFSTPIPGVINALLPTSSPLINCFYPQLSSLLGVPSIMNGYNQAYLNSIPPVASLINLHSQGIVNSLAALAGLQNQAATIGFPGISGYAGTTFGGLNPIVWANNINPFVTGLNQTVCGLNTHGNPFFTGV